MSNLNVIGKSQISHLLVNVNHVALLQIIRQLWPNANHYTKDLLKNVIEPNVREALKAYKMPGFQFDRMILGTIVSIAHYFTNVLFYQ